MDRPMDPRTSSPASPIYAILAAGRDAVAAAATAAAGPTAERAEATPSSVSPIFDRLAGRRLARRQPHPH